MSQTASKLDGLEDHELDRDAIKESHALDGDPERLTAYYAEWADSYDDDVRNANYVGPDVIADILATLHDGYFEGTRQGIRILDAGCGTGLSGVALVRKNFKRIDGFDLSHEMVDIARATGTYERLEGGVDLNQPLSGYDTDAYDVTVSCGVFTLGHVHPRALDELIRVTRPGGFVIASTRNSYYKSSGFEEERRRIEAEGKVELALCLDDANYVAEEGAHYWVFKVL